MTNYLGIDPGLNGAYAVLSDKALALHVDELPRFDKILNVHAWLSDLKHWPLHAAVIERVGAMPGQGVSSMFTFGCAYGACLGVLAALGVPYQLVTPVKWKAAYHLNGKPKDAARELATRLFPDIADRLNLKKHCGRADALLLAYYAQTSAEVV